MVPAGCCVACPKCVPAGLGRPFSLARNRVSRRRLEAPEIALDKDGVQVSRLRPGSAGWVGGCRMTWRCLIWRLPQHLLLPAPLIRPCTCPEQQATPEAFPRICMLTCSTLRQLPYVGDASCVPHSMDMPLHVVGENCVSVGQYPF